MENRCLNSSCLGEYSVSLDHDSQCGSEKKYFSSWKHIANGLNFFWFFILANISIEKKILASCIETLNVCHW